MGKSDRQKDGQTDEISERLIKSDRLTERNLSDRQTE